MGFSYEPNLWANVTGVRKREDSLKQFSSDVENSTTVPSQSERADSLGVHRDTVAKWEADRKVVLFEHREALQPNHPE